MLMFYVVSPFELGHGQMLKQLRPIAPTPSPSPAVPGLAAPSLFNPQSWVPGDVEMVGDSFRVKTDSAASKMPDLTLTTLKTHTIATCSDLACFGASRFLRRLGLAGGENHATQHTFCVCSTLQLL